MEIEATGHQARREPQFEWHVGGAEPNRRQADVVVAIDEAGQQRLLTRADDRRIWIGAAQLIKWADRGYDTVAPQHCAVVDLLPPMTIEPPRDDMLAAND